MAREAIVWFKDAKSVGINDVAVSKSGKLFVAGGTESSTGAVANFIASIDSTGHIEHVIRTTPFLPVYICASDDGTVWSYGVDKDDEGKAVESSMRLRQYGFNQGQLRALLSTSTLNSSGWTLTRGRYPGEISLRCNSQEVGLLNARSSEWVEFDIAKNKLTVSNIEPLPSPKEMQVTGFALTDSAGVFVGLYDKSRNPPFSGLFRLSPASSGSLSWVPVSNTVGPADQDAKVKELLGSEGNDLVYTRQTMDGIGYWSKFTNEPR